MKTIYKKRDSKLYQKYLAGFKKQFKDIDYMTKIYINNEKKVFAGEWIDYNGVVNFNGGYAIDAVCVVIFE